MRYKRFRDPIYGYIEIDENMIEEIVDSAAFQRLKDITQTSYVPLYSSALHNRFVHSLGVYYLGKMTVKSLADSLDEITRREIPNYQDYFRIFEVACLLHDVGHAPFSHTGEDFYLKDGKRNELHTEIIKLTNDDELKQEIEDNSYKAAPHELMSVIVSLKKYGKIIKPSMSSFFARCILGYKYTRNLDSDKSFKNCLIELLNSKIIDVDKLDYLLRDSYMTGFETISIDYVRLLDSICMIKEKNKFYKICFGKAAVSVIENVVYAHDAERKWIQNHPVVLYEIYLIETIIYKILTDIMKKDKIDYEFLTEDGIDIGKYGTVRLLGESDINYLMKNLDDKALTDEFYERNLRKHPIWKTEAEFQAIFKGFENELEFIEGEFVRLRGYLRTQGLSYIDTIALNSCRSEVEQLEEMMKGATGIEKQKLQISLDEKRRLINWMQIFKKFAENENIEFSFLVIYTEQFNSGFRKKEFENIELIFPELRNPCLFGEVTNVLTSNKSKGKNFFFIYYSRNENKEIKINELIKNMLVFAEQSNTYSKVEERLN